MGKLDLQAAGYKLSEDQKNCATCGHFTAGVNVCSLYGARVRADHVSEGYIAAKGGIAAELSEMAHESMHLSETDGLIWKDVLVEGSWALSPDVLGQPTRKPIKVVVDGEEPGVLSMRKLKQNFDDQAMDHVTVPLSHSDRPDENTGYVKALDIRKGKDGKHRLMAGFEFTEPDIKGKVERKTIPNVSVGVLFDYMRKRDGKKYDQALAHVALTSKPWLNGLTPFGSLAASQDLEIGSMVAMNFEDDSVPTGPAAPTGPGTEEPPSDEPPTEPVTPGDDEVPAVPDATDAEDESTDEVHTESGASVTADVSGDEEKVTITLPREALSLSEAQATRRALADGMGSNDDVISRGGDDVGNSTTELTLSEAQDRMRQLEEENRTLREAQKKEAVEQRVKEFGELGLSEHPGLLKEIRDIMLSDDGGPALMLSEEGKTGSQELTATQIVERIIEAFPKKDGKIALSEQAFTPAPGSDDGRPPADASGEKSVQEKTNEALAELGLAEAGTK